MSGAVGEKPKPRPPMGNDYIDFAVAQLRRMDYPDAANGLYDVIAAEYRRGLEEAAEIAESAGYTRAALLIRRALVTESSHV